MSSKALSGLKVVEYGEFISGPYCGKLLADLGAEVIKVEQPSFGDKARRWGPFPQDIPHPEKSGLFLYLNMNKLGVTLNLRSATGVKIFRELLKQVDVVVENNPPQEMERLGLDYANLHKVNPALVVTSITPFGQTGPYRNYKGCDFIGLHASGATSVNPTDIDDAEQQPPLKLPGHAGDFLTGVAGAIGTLSAVIARRVTGLGQQVDLSQQQVLAYMLCREIAEYADSGLPFYREQSKKTGIAPPVDHYPCKDGYIVLVLLDDEFWAATAEMMGNPEWANSELYRTTVSRLTNRGTMRPKILEWTREHTVKEITKAAQARRIPCTPIQSIKEVVSSEVLAARDFFVEVEHKEAGKVKSPGAPFKLSATPWIVERPAPLLGEHNEQVYCRMLGYTRQDFVKMRQAGVI